MEGGKGGGTYWPGFVDALTNVVIAMIFVIVVLAIALSFAAQLMGKRIADQYIAAAASAASSAAPPVPPASTPSAATVGSPPDTPPIPESRRAGRTRIAVAGPAASADAQPARVAAARNVLQLDFARNALTLDDAAAAQLKSALADVPRRAGVSIVATGPDMQLSGNQRAAYLRVMAVRNVLIEQGFPAAAISVRIDTQSSAAAAAVNVAFQEP